MRRSIVFIVTLIMLCIVVHAPTTTETFTYPDGAYQSAYYDDYTYGGASSSIEGNRAKLVWGYNNGLQTATIQSIDNVSYPFNISMDMEIIQDSYGNSYVSRNGIWLVNYNQATDNRTALMAFIIDSNGVSSTTQYFRVLVGTSVVETLGTFTQDWGSHEYKIEMTNSTFARFYYDGTLKGNYTLSTPLPASFLIRLGWASAEQTGSGSANEDGVYLDNATLVQNNAPTVTLDSPSDGSWSSSRTVSFNFTPTDDSGFANCSLWTNESGSWTNESLNTSDILNGSSNSISHDVGTDGAILWNVECYDSASLSAFASSNFTVNVDTVYPQLTIDSPTNTTYTQSWVWFNWSYVESNPDVFKYNLNDTGNISISKNWTLNSSIINGLTADFYEMPETFDLDRDGLPEMISGRYDGKFYGYEWDGSQWISNSTLVGGLGDVGYNSAPAISDFDNDGNFELITGDSVGTFTGYVWNGSYWNSYASIICGLGDIGDNSAPEFADLDNNGNEDELMVGEYASYSQMTSFKWNGSCWVSNSTFIDGITTGEFLYSYPTIEDYDNDGNVEMIVGEYYGGFYAYEWSYVYMNWTRNDSLISALGTTEFLTTPEFVDFDDDNVYELVSGWNNSIGSGTGEFKGWKFDYDYDINISGLVDGSTNMTLFSTDYVDNENSTTVWFTIDTTAPTTTINDTDSDWRNTNATWSLSCSDTTSSCDTTLYCTDTANTCTPSTVYSSPQEITSEGTTYIRFRSNDTVGNDESINSQAYRIDTTAPTTTINDTDSDWRNTDAVFSLSCSDSASGCDTTLYCTDTTNTCTPITQYSTPVTISADNMTYVRYLSNDTGGNTETANSQLYRIDKTAPAFSNEALNVTAFNDSSTVVGFTFNISDALNSVDSCWAELTLEDSTSTNITGTISSGLCTVASTISQIGDYSVIPYANDTLNNVGSGTSQSGVKVSVSLGDWRQNTLLESEVNGTAYVTHNITINNWLGSNQAADVPITLENRSGWSCDDKLFAASASAGSNSTTDYAINCTKQDMLYYLNYTYISLFSDDNDVDVDGSENVTFKFYANNSDTISYSSVKYNTSEFYESGWDNLSTAILSLSLGSGSFSSGTVNVSGVELASEIIPPSCPDDYTQYDTHCELKESFSTFVNYGYRYWASMNDNITKDYNISYSVPQSRMTDFSLRENVQFDVDDSALGVTLTVTNTTVDYLVDTTHGSSSLEEGNHYFDLTYTVSVIQAGGGGGPITFKFPYNFDIDPRELHIVGRQCSRASAPLSIKNEDIDDHAVDIFFEPQPVDIDESWSWLKWKVGRVENRTAMMVLEKDVMIAGRVYMDIVADIPCNATEGNYTARMLLRDDRSEYNEIPITIEVKNQTSIMMILDRTVWELSKPICMDAIYSSTIKAITAGNMTQNRSVLGGGQDVMCMNEFDAIQMKHILYPLPVLVAFAIIRDGIIGKFKSIRRSLKRRYR